jgi:predicted GIY-YIG superfamily endonuclease
MHGFHYVYILVSEADQTAHYTGLTEDLQERLRAHNAGKVAHTAKRRPWRLQTALAFRDRSRAAAFERYLKSGSGRQFARRHL